MQKNLSGSNLPDKELSALDKMRAHLLHDVPLDKELDRMLVRYRKAFTYMSENMSPGECIKMIQNEDHVSYSQACKSVRETIKLFGDVYDYNRQGLRQVMYERFMQLATRAELAEDFKASEKALHRACMVMDLYNPNNKGKMNQVFNIVINRTTNPDVLKDQNTIDITPEDE